MPLLVTVYVTGVFAVFRHEDPFDPVPEMERLGLEEEAIPFTAISSTHQNSWNALFTATILI